MSTAAESRSAPSNPEALVASNPLWYHTLELGPGVETPGWFDLRPILDRLPWPDVRGKRCLDIGTYDGHLAFELERRGAATVVATDISDHDRWDWPSNLRRHGPKYLEQLAGPEKGKGFEIAKELLGSSVEKVEISIYDLAPDRTGEFDVVVCGSLMLHLRDPIGALEAVRSVCRGEFLSAEEVDLRLTALHRRRPYARLDGTSQWLHWWVPSAAGHVQMLEAGGFEVDRRSGLYAIPFGKGHPVSRRRGLEGLVHRVLTGGHGTPHQALLARPRF